MDCIATIDAMFFLQNYKMEYILCLYNQPYEKKTTATAFPFFISSCLLDVQSSEATSSMGYRIYLLTNLIILFLLKKIGFGILKMSHHII